MKTLCRNIFLGVGILLLVCAFVILLFVGVPLFIGHVAWIAFTTLNWTEGVWSNLAKWSIGFLLMMLTGGIKIGVSK
ncbi:MAG: hypothetical protein GOV00_00420 [Candidatus Altiarchaeota archaeon]|nr:hypothetical protein [Candidatus Altiarchaeota archaeon]